MEHHIMPAIATLAIGEASIRSQDGLYSLNDLHRASGGDSNHQPAFFLRNEQTKALIAEISSANSQNQAISVHRGRGTYACRELVIAYAAWISPASRIRTSTATAPITNTASKPPAPRKNSGKPPSPN
jgi:hypothetical protein